MNFKLNKITMIISLSLSKNLQLNKQLKYNETKYVDSVNTVKKIDFSRF